MYPVVSTTQGGLVPLWKAPLRPTTAVSYTHLDVYKRQVLEKATGTCAPTQLAELQDKPVLHTDVVDIDGMASFVEQAAGGLK